MKRAILPIFLFFFTAAILLPVAAAPRKSLLDNDPDVIYLNEHLDHIIHLTIANPAEIYSTKNGGRRLGTFPTNTKVQLLAIGGANAYRVKGKAKHSVVSGWVSPKMLTSKDKNFAANLKEFYDRQIIVTDLIAMQDVAIGMTLDEVKKSLGEPTKTEAKQTRKGTSGKWEYIVAKEEKHYRTIIDSRTGQTYRQLSHITTEEKSKISVEFENGVITSVTKKKNNGQGKVRIIPIPVIFGW